jgi:hypothetical protein
MSKGGKKNSTTAVSSRLSEAYAAFERGNAVEARTLARQVLWSEPVPADVLAAKDLASVFSVPDAEVASTPDAVARELILRTKVPGRAFLFAGLAAFVYVLLVVLATVRYSNLS